MELDVICEDPRWEDAGLGHLTEVALGAVGQDLGLPLDALELSVLGCNDAEIAILNAQFRDKPSATNILSWPAEDLTPPALPDAGPDGAVALGDLALAFETCTQEAQAQSKAFGDHVTHLLVHGLLHLLGYDHEDDAQACIMEAKETEILGNLGISDPYLDQTPT